ncbi:transmembrane protein, putative [Medicago truncatula]|uniref:Transmembrane protein, putative n=1 Tax=Medicago truncatula TaxID=3880 RepID=A0A072VA33_MEDTR|nr:transmembrane protein, putative [Medicago truncatula]
MIPHGPKLESLASHNKYNTNKVMLETSILMTHNVLVVVVVFVVVMLLWVFLYEFVVDGVFKHTDVSWRGLFKLRLHEFLTFRLWFLEMTSWFDV